MRKNEHYPSRKEVTIVAIGFSILATGVIAAWLKGHISLADSANHLRKTAGNRSFDIEDIDFRYTVNPNGYMVERSSLNDRGERVVNRCDISYAEGSHIPNSIFMARDVFGIDTDVATREVFYQEHGLRLTPDGGIEPKEVRSFLFGCEETVYGFRREQLNAWISPA